MNVPDIVWRVAELPNLRASYSDWLHAAEIRALESFRDPTRRDAWVAGRMLAKRLLLERSQLPERAVCVLPRQIRICSRNEAGRSTAPRVTLADKLWPCTLSIAHSSHSAAAALAVNHRCAIGIDLVPLDDPKLRSLFFWFQPHEQRYAERRGPDGAAALWAVKEAAYKTLGDGSPFMPRRIAIDPATLDDANWRWHVSGPASGASGWARWWANNGHVAAVGWRDVSDVVQ